MYNKKVLKYFKEPKNQGKIKNPSGTGEAGNPVCGDVMKFYIKVDKNEVIKDVKFETLGCGVAIAISSIITEMVKGKTLQEAKKINTKKVLTELGLVPNTKKHCCVLGAEALLIAIKNYEEKHIKRPKKTNKA